MLPRRSPLHKARSPAEKRVRSSATRAMSILVGRIIFSRSRDEFAKSTRANFVPSEQVRPPKREYTWCYQDKFFFPLKDYLFSYLALYFSPASRLSESINDYDFEKPFDNGILNKNNTEYASTIHEFQAYFYVAGSSGVYNRVLRRKT